METLRATDENPDLLESPADGKLSNPRTADPSTIGGPHLEAHGIVSRKNICSIPCSWTLADYAAHNCADGSHRHFSRRQIYEVDQKGLVVWLKVGATRRESSVVYILPAPAGPSTKTPLTTGPVNTGLSNRVGEELATAFYEGREWARVMLQQINTRRGDSNRRSSDT